MSGEAPAPSARPSGQAQAALWSRLVRGLVGFFVAAALAWLLVQALELRSLRAEIEPRAALSYLARNALAYSTRLGAVLLAVHALRAGIARISQHADAYTASLLAALLFTPTWQQAYLLTTGNQIIDSALAIPLRVAFFAVLLGANLTLWYVHLGLSRAPQLTAAGWLGKLLQQRVPARLRGVVRSAVSLAALAILLHAINHSLRQYTFLARFLLPSSWLLAASFLYAGFCRTPPRAQWPLLLAASGLLALLAWPANSHGLKRAQTVFVRTGATAGLTDLEVRKRHPPAFANIDISRARSQRCANESSPVALRWSRAALARRNVILISVDALRKDTLAERRDGHLVMPQLAAFASESRVFERAVTSYPATLFAVGSALTGKSASEVLLAPRLPDNIFTLARGRFDQELAALPDNGWFTKPIVPLLFTQLAQTSFSAHAAEQTRWLTARLQAARKHHDRVLAWVHYYETHESIDRAAAKGGNPRTAYLNDATLVDHEIGELLRYLRTSGLMDDSLIVLFADHGEALGERGYFGHHVYLNRWITDIPLLVHAPGLLPQRSNALVSIADIAPSVLDWVGVAVPSSDARSLLTEQAVTDGDPGRYAYSEAFPVRGSALFDLASDPIRGVTALLSRIARVQQSAEDYLPKVSVTSSRYRLIVNRVTGAEELYDRERDPAEAHDLADEGRPVQARLRAALARWNRNLSARIYCRVAHE